MYTMQECLEVTNIGTKHIEGYWDKLDFIEKIQNVEDIPLFRKLDIDFILYLPNHNPTMQFVEIKVDRYMTGNFFFETISNRGKDTQGCIYVSQADWLYYYFLYTNELYIFDLPKLKNMLSDNEEYLRRFTKQTSTGNSEHQFYKSTGLAVPINYVVSKLSVFKIKLQEGVHFYE